jgi:hypothetical protein
MSQKKVYVKQKFNVSVERLFEYLSIHENLDTILSPVKSKLFTKGIETPYGLGSVRQMKAPFGTFQETITACEANKRIEYKITQGSPLKNHHGIMIFSGDANQSKLEYTIVFEGKFPLVGYIVHKGLQKSVGKGLAILAATNLKTI